MYEQLRLEDNVTWSASRDDDVGMRFDDHVGLAKRVRDRCQQQSEIVRLVMHRETVYQGQQLHRHSVVNDNNG